MTDKPHHISIVAEEQHARRIISHLITRKSREPIEFFYLEGEYIIILPPNVDLIRLREKLKGVEFYVE